MRLKELRLNYGLTQKDIATKLNCSTSVYSRYEKGERGMDYHTLLQLSELFKVSIDYILENDEYAMEDRSYSDKLSDMDTLILKKFHEADQFDQVAVLRILKISNRL